ncbi:Natural resistance-associated macrophage protein [Nesidiocoris tenuis]|uniref:Natural resistance-associated macrophage protein n=1 Tax=Nesidiocoris tenuis TaxID=355587 RepID=A0ABN7AI64_9HEMI|nr:Natural resistance-associated macrophage protein [Nesidiocoris tenuis]
MPPHSSDSPPNDLSMTEGAKQLKKISRLKATDSDNELLELKVNIPEDERDGFSFRKLWAFSGPGFLMSIAFLDPGNIEADLQSGAYANYQLFWVLFWSTLMGLLVQRLAARVGTVTGQHLAEICYTEYRTVPRLFVWIMMEIAIIGSDMQEVIGTAISLYLLTDGKFPLWGGVVVTVIDTLTFVFLDKYGLRKLELFFAILISVMAISFGYEFFVAKPTFLGIAEGTIVPRCSGCSTDTRKVLLAIGIIGSCIMPHNLYLHSGLVKTREIDRSSTKKISEANFYFLVESAVALAVSFMINLFVMSVFAEGLYQKKNDDVLDQCVAAGSPYAHEFTNDTRPVDVNLYKGGIYLGCAFGNVALYVWAVGILAAGQSSTMTGCYSGQFTMEGFLKLTWVRWKRVLLTRSIAVVPSFFVAMFSNMDNFSNLNDLMNALMSIQLPFAVLPAIAFSSNPRIVGEFANGKTQKIISVLTFLLIFAGNTILVVQYVEDIESPWILTFFGLYFAIYLIICLYLALHCLAALFDPDSAINRNRFMRNYILGKSITEYHDEREAKSAAWLRETGQRF